MISSTIAIALLVSFFVVVFLIWAIIKGAKQEAIKQVVKIIDNFDVEPCCHGLNVKELKVELGKIK